MITHLYRLNLKWIVRDRVLQALLGVALLLLVLVPAFSIMSMRQVQELAVTLSLSFISFVLLVLATLLGASSIWRDIEKRYAASILTLPHSRAQYLLGKFLAIAACLLGSALLLALVGAAAVFLCSLLYPSTTHVQWGHFIVAVAFDAMKYTLLAAVAIVFSSLSTSFFLPIFGTIALFIAGNASQEVYEYVIGEGGTKLPGFVVAGAKFFYFIIPNFSAFDHKVAAIYPVPLDYVGLLYTLLYFVIYAGIALSAAIWIFSRRELP